MINPNRLDEASPHGILAAVGVAFLLVVALNRALARGRLVRAREPSPTCCNGSTSSRSARCAMSCRSTGLNRALVAQGIKVARGVAQSRPRGARRGRRGQRAARRLSSRLCAGAAGQCRRPGRRRRSRRAAARHRRSGARRRTGARGSTATTASAARSRRSTLDAAIDAVEAAAAIAGAGVRRRPRAGIPASSASSRRGSRSATSGRPASSRLRTGIGKGSGRSVPGVALGPAVIAARQAGLLINGGGHAMAAGFTVAADRLDALRDFLAERLGDGLERRARWCPSWRSTARCRRRAPSAGLIDHHRRAGAVRRRQPRAALCLSRASRRPCRAGRQRRICAAPLPMPLGPGAALKAIAFRVADTPLGAFLAATRGRGDPCRRPSAARHLPRRRCRPAGHRRRPAPVESRS